MVQPAIQFRFRCPIQGVLFGKQFFPNFAAFLVYAAMIAVLIARPQGLFRGTGT